MTCRAAISKVTHDAAIKVEAKISSPLEPLINLYKEVCRQSVVEEKVSEPVFPSVLEFQKIALAQSLIITAYSYLNSIFQVACTVYQKDFKNSQIGDLRDKVLKLGPELVAVSWGSGLKAACDYVKNADDWNVMRPESRTDAKPDICEELTDLLGQLEKDIHQTTIHHLLYLGLTEDEIYQQDYNLAPKLVSLLKLDSLETFQEFSGEWVRQVYHYFKTQSRPAPAPIRRSSAAAKNKPSFVEVIHQKTA